MIIKINKIYNYIIIFLSQIRIEINTKNYFISKSNIIINKFEINFK